MDWLSAGKQLASMGLKAVGAVVGGPFGATVGGQIANLLGCDNTPDAVEQALTAASPETLAKLKEFEKEIRLAEIDLEKTEVVTDSENIKTVNETMREESKSEHWPQWSWRPYNGFMFGTTFFCVYFVLPLYEQTVPEIDASAWMMWGAVLGVTAWGRNNIKAIQTGNAPTGILGSIANRIGGKK